MALLRLSNGRFYTDIKTINELIAPVQIGSFDIRPEIASSVNDPELKFDRKFADLMYERAAPGTEKILKDAGFEDKERRLAVYIPPKTSKDPHQFITLLDGDEQAEPAPLRDEDFGAYLVPHRFPVNDWHFCFIGTMAKGLRLENGEQAVLYVFAGEWMRLRPTVLNWPVFQSATPIIGLSYFEEKANEHGAYDMELVPDFVPEETMKF